MALLSRMHTYLEDDMKEGIWRVGQNKKVVLLNG